MGLIDTPISSGQLPALARVRPALVTDKSAPGLRKRAQRRRAPGLRRNRSAQQRGGNDRTGEKY